MTISVLVPAKRMVDVNMRLAPIRYSRESRAPTTSAT